MLSEPQHALYWHADVSQYNMEALVFFSTGWLKTFFVVLALFWVAYRGYQVLSKPVEELVALLGLEVPVAPIVSLAGIKADGVLLHWKPPDPRSSVLKYVIRINGIDIGDVSPQETSVTIENLQPDTHYVIRIVTLNSANFQAPSIPIRLKTLHASSDQFYNSAPHKETQDGAEDDCYTPTPVIRPNKNLVDIIIPSIASPVMAREHSNSISSRVRRSEPGRRNSPASQTADQARSAQEAADTTQSIKQLTEKLDSLRREIDEAEKEIAKEDEEFHGTRTAVQEKRDETKNALKDKEDASRDLRREAATSERANAAAQARKAQQEKLLRQKEAERKKLKDDVMRWHREIQTFRADAERRESERAEYEEAAVIKTRNLKVKHAEELLLNKGLEDAIRDTGVQVKTLEEERKKLEEGEEGLEPDATGENAEAEEDRRWIATLNSLQQHYAQAWSLFTEAERANQEASNRLAFLQQRRLSQPHLFAGFQEVAPVRRNSLRARPLSMRENLAVAAPGGFVHTTGAPFSNTIPGSSPTFQNPTPYFNINNGMALPPPSANLGSFSHSEIESLTGGAPMSPTAGALLPSDLFGNEADRIDTDDEDEDDPGPPQPNLPGLGAPATSEQTQDPSSPVSANSRSPSVFASPLDSAQQLAYYPNHENFDSDRRSIRSTSSSFLQNGPTTRFGGLFGLNRQRGKTFSDQGPPLGSLKGSQSQSMPRQDHAVPGPIGTQRRRGSHSGGAWFDAFRPSRTHTEPVDSPSSPKHVVTRRRPFNMFGSKGDPWLAATLGLERPSSPRQGSTKSGEASLLPRPSTESQTRFGWPIDGFGTRNSPLGADWSINHTTSWSSMPSRRPSIQHGSTGNLVHEDLLLGDTPDFPSTSRSPTQAPIGTRPQSSASHMPPIPPTPPKQLNPAAPTFKTIFAYKKSEEEKAEKAKKAAEKAAEKEAKKAEKKEEKKSRAEKSDKGKKVALAEIDTGREATSPTAPRQSRDNRSMSTADMSEASPRESLERSISHTPSDAQGSANAFNKESFMQKLSRKSSSSQFLPFGKSKAASLFSKKTSEVVTPDEADEEGGGYMERGAMSAGNSPAIGTPKDKASALSWSSIKRMGKRGDKTPSLHESIASETTGDEDEDETTLATA